MIANRKKDQCCGCAACFNACPSGAIKMQADECGFLYPAVDQEKCNQCGICERVCSFDSTKYRHNETGKPREAFFGRSVDMSVVAGSRSGGTFVELAVFVFSLGGVVYGTVCTRGGDFLFTRAENAEQLEPMRGVKYVQSRIGDCYRRIKEDLKEHKVLFAGTGCQVAGLYGFLQKEEPNLITVDIICHGVPSPLIWKENCKRIERKYKGKIEKAEFRDKTECGWSTHLESYWIRGKKYYDEEYAILFYGNHSLRPSCFQCIYANLARSGDLTIGDGWRIGECRLEEKNVSLNDNRGVSLILINTVTGKKIWREIQKRFILYPCREAEYLQKNLISPSERPVDYEQFWKDFVDKGYEECVKKYVIKKKGRTKLFLKRTVKVQLLKKGWQRF